MKIKDILENIIGIYNGSNVYSSQNIEKIHIRVTYLTVNRCDSLSVCGFFPLLGFPDMSTMYIFVNSYYTVCGKRWYSGQAGVSNLNPGSVICFWDEKTGSETAMGGGGGRSAPPSVKIIV